MNKRGFGSVFSRGPIWWIQYYFRGQRYRESTNSRNRIDALRLLKCRLAEMGKGQLIGPSIDKTTFEDLADCIEQDYLANRRKSIKTMLSKFRALRQVFGTSFARDITLDRLNRYVASRLQVGIAPATVKQEIDLLRHAFKLAERAGKCICPHFPHIAVQNTRAGFFEREHLDRLRMHLPEEVKAFVTFAYLTGWRTLSEILPLQWKQVDFSAGIVRLEPGTTKNDEARVFPFTALPELVEVLLQQWEYTNECQLRLGMNIPWVFHRKGVPIRDFTKVWRKACRLSGLVARIPHDFRRTAVRNLERAGVPRSVAMKLTGHKTESVYRRYAIVSEADLTEGLSKLARLNEREKQNRRSATEPPQFREPMTDEVGIELMQVLDNGAGDRDRTGTGLVGPRDFKSLAYANFATPARRRPGRMLTSGLKAVKTATTTVTVRRFRSQAGRSHASTLFQRYRVMP